MRRAEGLPLNGDAGEPQNGKGRHDEVASDPVIADIYSALLGALYQRESLALASENAFANSERLSAPFTSNGPIRNAGVPEMPRAKAWVAVRAKAVWILVCPA